MKEIISGIREVHGELYDGYEVVTNKQSISVLIDNQQNCCESWGYLISEDNPATLVGAELRGIEIANNGLTVKMIEAGQSLDEAFQRLHDAGSDLWARVIDALRIKKVLEWLLRKVVR